ncbi:hypothetical protein ACEXQD_06705 [Herbiconiux sp. P15]|uniref:hypothetical protein n=1 Tax=Herbiconiux liukaitaii TaxID=3342799 RepID=UPI0035B8EB72
MTHALRSRHRGCSFSAKEAILLQDCTLDLISMDWDKKTALMKTSEADPLFVDAAEVLSFNFTRFEPWGGSSRVYQAEFYAEHPLGNWLMLRLQTGDYMELIAGSISIRSGE